MTVIKFFGGDLGGDATYYRCNLSQASSPIQLWNDEDECWEPTQYQCADARHQDELMAELCMREIADGLEIPFDDFACKWKIVDGVPAKRQ